MNHIFTVKIPLNECRSLGDFANAVRRLAYKRGSYTHIRSLETVVDGLALEIEYFV